MAPTKFPDGFVRDSPVQVRPIVVVEEVSIESLQQQVRMFWGKVREVYAFLRGGHVPSHADHLYRCSPWGISVPFPFLLIPPILLHLRLVSALRCLLEILPLILTFSEGYPAAPSPCVPPATSSSSSSAPASAPLSSDPPGGSGLSSVGFRGLFARQDSPRRLINYRGHYPLRLLLWRPLRLDGGGARSPCPIPVRHSLVAPSLPICLAVGGLCRYGNIPPISCI